MKKAAQNLAAVYSTAGMTSAQERPTCLRCGRAMRALGIRPRTVATKVGLVRFTRQVYHCAACGSTQAPLDRELGCEATQYSAGARTWCQMVGAAVSFREAAHLLRTLTRVHADASVIEQMCADTGAAMEEHSHAATTTPRTKAAADTATPKLLYIAVDGAMAPIRDSQRPWQEVRVGVVFTPHPDHGTASLGRREYCAYLGTMEAFTPRLWERAAAWGACGAHRIVFLGDGAKANWNLAETLFPGAVHILDFYHAMEHLAVIKGCLVFPAPALAEKWYRTVCRALKRGRWSTVMKLMMSRQVHHHARAVWEREYAYFQHNRERMRYGEFRACGYYIGSGVVESACKQVVDRRLRVPGARWDAQRCQAMLNLRCAYLTAMHNLTSAA